MLAAPRALPNYWIQWGQYHTFWDTGHYEMQQNMILDF